MNKALLLKQFEELLRERIQRELDKLKNIAEVNRPEALIIGLAQCCAYARFVRSKDKRQTALTLLDLLALMCRAVGITIGDIEGIR